MQHQASTVPNTGRRNASRGLVISRYWVKISALSWRSANDSGQRLEANEFSALLRSELAVAEPVAGMVADSA